MTEPTIILAIHLTADELDVICADVNHCADHCFTDSGNMFLSPDARAKKLARGDMRIELANRIRAAATGEKS